MRKRKTMQALDDPLTPAEQEVLIAALIEADRELVVAGAELDLAEAYLKTLVAEKSLKAIEASK